MIFYIQYIESTDDYALHFSGLEYPISFDSRAECILFARDFVSGSDFTIVDVNDDNWQQLFDAGAFD